MKSYVYKIIFMSSILSVSSLQYADLSGRTYNQKIIAIENMLDGVIPMDIAFVQSNLNLLKDRTISPDRVNRINNAYRRFNVFMENRKRAAPVQLPVQGNPEQVSLVQAPAQSALQPIINQAPLVPIFSPEPLRLPEPTPAKLPELPAPEPLLLPEPAAQRNPVAPSPLIQGLSPEQQLETLLLYVQSLASTADVAIAVGQKDNAHTILAQAASQFPLMDTIVQQNPQLAQRFNARIQTISNRIAKTQEEVNLMP